MNDVMVELESVSKKFRRGQLHDSLRDLIPSLAKSIWRGRASDRLGQQEFWALRDVSFQVRRGEAVGIIGHNGAGKSTILKILTDVMKPTVGRKMVKGSLSALIEVGAGFHQDLTGRENIFLNGTILGMSRRKIESKFDEIVEFAGLEQFIDTPVKRYSSGMYARLGFAIACHVEPEVLIVDEVLSVGDWTFQNKSLEKMRGILEGGATVIFVSHNLKAISDFCDRVILLDRGQILTEGPPDDVIRQYIKQAEETSPDEHGDKPAIIQDVALQSNGLDVAILEPGQPIVLSVTIRNRSCTEPVAVSMSVRDERSSRVFATDSIRCGEKPTSLSPGEARRYRFSLDAHLAPGTYFVNVALDVAEPKRLIDHRATAIRFVVHSDDRVRGSANLYPRLDVSRL